LKNYDVIIIGAGAAGLIAAGRAGELGAKVLVLEKMERAGRKLLITGKGRCNITNQATIAEYQKHIYPNGRLLKHAFSQFFNKDIVALLESQGVETVLERGDRIFPVSDKAADVVNALVNRTSKFDVDIEYHAKVEDILTSDQAITGVRVLKNGVKTDYFAPNVIFCTGGCSYPATGSSGDGYRLAKNVGHTTTTVLPALVPIETEGATAPDLQGLSLKNVNAIIWIDGKKQKEEFGEMLFTHFGVSGPIILTLSRFVVQEFNNKKNIELSIDLKPALDDMQLDSRLQRDLNEHGKKQIDNIFKLWLPGKLIDVFMQLANIDGTKLCNQITAAERKKIRVLMKDFRLKVSGYRSFKEAIITSGGINNAEIDFKTMESKIIKNLYFAGEVIDVDADTGGFNLQIAWSTAYLAAQSCVNKMNSLFEK
jgi:predicted Rossmann fold flavoprotein